MCVIGHFDTPLLLPECSDLNITFQPYKESDWKHCAIITNCVANYYSLMIPTQEKYFSADEINHYVSYILNELIENAVKFRKTGQITIQSYLDKENTDTKEHIILLVSNMISRSQEAALTQLTSTLVSADTDLEQLMLEKLEYNALGKDEAASGLGFITIMHDYHTPLAWKLVPHIDTPFTKLTTMAKIAITVD